MLIAAVGDCAPVTVRGQSGWALSFAVQVATE